jgi:hypothetical protein
MSRSYFVLAAIFLGVAGLVGVAAAATRPGGSGAPADRIEAPTTVALLDEGGAEARLEAVADPDPDCELTLRLELGDESDEVACLESRLIAAGVLFDVEPDNTFDEATYAAVRTFQEQHRLVVDGMIGPQTADALGAWAGLDLLPPDGSCPATGRSAVIDRSIQHAWLCESGEVTAEMPITTALSQPDPGTYDVYAKDLNASSSISGKYSTMTHFVAFTHGKNRGARIAFHSVPRYADGEFVQPLDSVGTQELRGDSAGCIRVLPDDAELIWSWLDVGDTVSVIT